MGDLTGSCPCCGKGAIKKNLRTGLVRLNSIAGGRIRLLSGYRCAKHNGEVGGSPTSKHLTGDAADITTPDCDVQTLAGLAESIDMFRLGGIGQYPKRNFVHVDNRIGVSRWIA